MNYYAKLNRRKSLSSAILTHLSNIITFIRQTLLCEASHNSVTVSVIEAIGRRIREVDEELKREDAEREQGEAA